MVASKFGVRILMMIGLGLSGSLLGLLPAAAQVHARTESEAKAVLSFFDECCNGEWYGAAPQSNPERLPCPGSDSDESGFVRKLGPNFWLETDQPATRAIQTHPKWVANGYIYGVFNLQKLGIVLGSTDRFVAEVGFLKNASQGEVRFSIWYDAQPGQPGGETKMAEVEDIYDGRLRTLAASLSKFRGQQGAIILRVDALKTSAQDWAVWLNPRLEAASTATPVSTATSPPSPSPTFSPMPSATPVSTATSPPSPIPSATIALAPQPPIIEPAPMGEGISPLAEGFSWIVEGPVMREALEDGDGDGVLNLWDECPDTPAEMAGKVFENGCLCQDSDGGYTYSRKGVVSYVLADGEGSRSDFCVGDTLHEAACSPAFERGVGDPVQVREVECSTLGSHYQCRNGRCIPVVKAIPQYCWSAEGSCSDGIQNQNEEGVDCGGKCPPCNTRCATGTRYAPPDTPCTSNYPTDPHRIDLPWTDSSLEYTCQFHEVCHPDLDYIIEEALRCCSIRSGPRPGMTDEESERIEEIEINSMPDPDLCQEARRLTGQSASCQRCVGLYIIRGLGSYARWMQGYTWLYSEHHVYEDVDQLPAELLVNEYKTGICRDYAEVVSTLLRKAGFSPQDVGGRCDGDHCYNAVRLPGDRGWHVVDTTGNIQGIVLGGLPSGYPYCQYFDETNWCWDGERSNGDACTGTEAFERDHASHCRPGFTCNRDLRETPGWAPPFRDIVGCGR